ncbi:copper amine oxidase N-terminal domain-containing protein [Paenibacillus pabuli]|uniref:copper amine oxidase N-terminal domain-containing protein n=1 Tax=Paenibacillus pabuli TaxID=1472 RepID=UPI00078067D0|nr:copper amine oxidase N-terminal domain-containing protein [Paenibacillus pabuli]MEC0125626.1 copper amine oxidase N-terminal domain-containing protein [Paenibacillus pabuli]
MKKAGGRQVKKVMSALAVSAMLMSALPTSVMDAAARISIYINDAELASAQAPVMKGGRVLVPLRSIFEGLDATVKYTNKTKTITASRDDQEVILKLGSKTAYINGEAISLDVPANTIKGNTMVPIRFVSEAFGEKVFWNSRKQRVDIKTTSTPPVDETKYAAWNVYGSVSGSNGDGRDLTVSFTRPSSEKAVSAYRIMLVKTRDVNSFNESAASAVPASNYTSVTPNGSNPRLTLNAQTRDVNGDLLNSNETYRLYVLTVGNSSNSYKNQLAWSSQSLKLNNVKTTVQPVTGLKIADISDYGDGRDLEVNFTQPSTTSNITYYRAFVVKAKDASSFNLTAANNVSSSNSTIIYKGNSTTVKSQLSSSTRDTSGELIKSGTSYVVYIMSVSSNAATADNKLSAVSSSLTLGVNTATAPVITSVRDITDYGDGRDIQVSFNRSSDESKVANYRIFVVRNSVSSSFNLTTASNLSSSLYYTVNKTGNNITTTLPSSMKDTSGYNVTNLQDYRIYVMAVGNQQNGYTNALSFSSGQLRLTTNSNAGVASNIGVADVSDYGDGRDLKVSFTKASDESNVSAYRVYVVRSNIAGSFTLSAANASNNYYQVNKTGGNQSFTLPSNAVDTSGYRIANNVGYRVFVLSVSTSGNSSQNALSSYSSQITLTQNATAAAPTSVTAADIGDNGDGRDLQVTFNRSSNEANVYHYRVFVVKTGNLSGFDLAEANRNSNFKVVNKASGSGNYTLTLNDVKATDGTNIRNDENYRIFVLAVSNTGNSSNVLSTAYADIKLSVTSAVGAVKITDVEVKNEEQAAGDATDVTLRYTEPASKVGIGRYVVMIAPTGSAFDLSMAKNIASAKNSRSVGINGSPALLSNALFDINGQKIEAGKSYTAYILSESSDNKRDSSLASSSEFTINGKKQAPVPVEKATGVTATATTSSIDVSFTKPASETGIARYDIYIVKDTSNTLDNGRGIRVGTVNSGAGNPSTANVNITGNSTDSDGVAFGPGKYKIRVVSVASDVKYTTTQSEVATFPIPAAPTGTDQGSSNTPAPASNPDTGNPATAGDTPSS